MHAIRIRFTAEELCHFLPSINDSHGKTRSSSQETKHPELFWSQPKSENHHLHSSEHTLGYILLKLVNALKKATLLQMRETKLIPTCCVRQICKEGILFKRIFCERRCWIQSRPHSPVLLARCMVPPCHSLFLFYSLLISGGCVWLSILRHQHSGCRGTFAGNCCDVTHTHWLHSESQNNMGGVVFWFLACSFLSQFSFEKKLKAAKTYAAESEESRKLYLRV